MSRLFTRLLLMALIGVPLIGCPDDDPDDPVNDMLVDIGTDGPLADAAPADGAPPDGAPPDADLPPDAGPPDAAPPGPVADREPLIDVCSGCGVARSADYIVTQKIVPRTPRTARSADFTMELHAAPIAPEAGR